MHKVYSDESSRQVSTGLEWSPDTVVGLTEAGRSAIVSFGKPGRAPVHQAKPDGAALPKKAKLDLGRRVYAGSTSVEGVIIEIGVSTAENPQKSNYRRVQVPGRRPKWFSTSDLALIEEPIMQPLRVHTKPQPVTVYVSSGDIHRCVRNWRTLANK
jgi:hypothetical protein